MTQRGGINFRLYLHSRRLARPRFLRRSRVWGAYVRWDGPPPE